MKPGTRKLLHLMIMLLAVSALVAAHGAILYFISSHAPLSIAVAAVGLVVIKHLGLFGPILVWFRRRRPRCTP